MDSLGGFRSELNSGRPAHNVNPADMMARGRGEGGIHRDDDDTEWNGLVRKESGRERPIRGQEFKNIEGRGRGE